MQFDPLDLFDDSIDVLLQNTLFAFNTRLQPLDSQISSCIQKQVHNLDAPPFVILSTFEKLPHIVKRQGVKKNLHVLITRLNKLIKELLAVIDTTIGESVECIDPVEGIFKCRQCKRKIEKIRIGFQAVASNDIIQVDCVELDKRCTNFEKKIFNKWITKTGDLLETSLHSLEHEETLIKIYDSKVFRVTFYDELAKLIEQERKLRVLGFNTLEIAEKIAVAKKYYKLGSYLNKSIMLRNSVEHQVSSEQRDLLHTLITEFDRMVKKHCGEQLSTKYDNSTTLSWTDHGACDRFASKLNNVAKKLSIETKNIRLIHFKNSQRICALFTYDLLSQKSSWLRHYREVEEAILAQSFNVESKWGLYWAHQVYKAVEATYIKGLLNLNKFAKDLRCEMLINGDKVDIHPPFSELRAEMYAQLQSFVEYPSDHMNIFGENVLFKTIPVVNEKLVAEVYRICEQCITSLKDMICQYSNQAIINFEISSYAKAYCHRAKDFAKGFEWFQNQRKLVEKWPEILTIQYSMKVSLSRLKRIVVDRLLFFQDSLRDSLQISALSDYQIVVEYMSTTTFLLAQVPSEVSDISRAESDWKAAKLQLSNIEHKAASSRDKFELLNSISQSANYSSVHSLLDKINEMKLIEVRRVPFHQLNHN